MVRKIIKIDEDLCNGCGLCVTACHEGAIAMVDGKAKLMRDDYCDGLGDCLPVCPTGAISFEEREAAAYDEAAVKAKMKKAEEASQTTPCGCPGKRAQTIKRAAPEFSEQSPFSRQQSELVQWPVQLKLVPFNAQYLKGAHLTIAADCTAYAYANFHSDFMKNRVTLIGCPMLDNESYVEKLTQILVNNEIKSVKVVRMEVPCCSGIENAVKAALKNSGKLIPWQIITVTTNGDVLEN